MARVRKVKQSEASEPVARRLRGSAVVRPRDDVPHGVPVALRSAQHVVVARGRFEPFTSRRAVLIEWVIRGEAAMEIAGRRVPFRSGEVAIYLPTVPFRFWAVAPESEMCWFTVDGPLAEPLVMHLELAPGVYPFGPPPVAQIDEMMRLLRDHTIQGWRRASFAALRMLYDVAERTVRPEAPSVVAQVQHLIQQEFPNPEFSIDALAAKLNYHRGSLSRLFHRHAGVTIIDYLTQVRVQEAAALLQHGGDKVAEVARKCGFRDVAYFSRWLRKHTRMSPVQLRNSTQK